MGKTFDFFVDRGVFGRIKSLFQCIDIGLVICFRIGDFATQKVDSISVALVVGCGVVYASDWHIPASLAGGKSGLAAGPDNKISV